MTINFDFLFIQQPADISLRASINNISKEVDGLDLELRALTAIPRNDRGNTIVSGYRKEAGEITQSIDKINEIKLKLETIEAKLRNVPSDRQFEWEMEQAESQIKELQSFCNNELSIYNNALSNEGVFTREYRFFQN